MNSPAPDVRQNYFELFDLPVSCSIDDAVLRSKYMSLQRQFHPDRYASADSQHRRVAVQIAATVNQAHDTLSDPLKRAEYCLTVRGHNVDVETDTSMDTQFLMEQMQWREKLEELSDSGHNALRELSELRAEIGENIKSIADKTADMIENEDNTGARDQIRKWQFLVKIDREAKAVGARLNDLQSG